VDGTNTPSLLGTNERILLNTKSIEVFLSAIKASKAVFFGHTVAELLLIGKILLAKGEGGGSRLTEKGTTFGCDTYEGEIKQYAAKYNVKAYYKTTLDWRRAPKCWANTGCTFGPTPVDPSSSS
jgi:hypothetical protein